MVAEESQEAVRDHREDAAVLAAVAAAAAAAVAAMAAATTAAAADSVCRAVFAAASLIACGSGWGYVQRMGTMMGGKKKTTYWKEIRKTNDHLILHTRKMGKE